MTSTVSSVDEARPKSSEMARPWKIGSVRITAAPIIAASAVSRIGLKRIGAGLEQHVAQRPLPGVPAWRMKSTSRIELRTMMPASAMKPIIEVAVNGAANSQWPSMMPMKVSGIGVRMTSGSLNEPNWATTRM